MVIQVILAPSIEGLQTTKRQILRGGMALGTSQSWSVSSALVSPECQPGNGASDPKFKYPSLILIKFITHAFFFIEVTRYIYFCSAPYFLDQVFGSFKGDIFALCCAFFFLLHGGRHPFGSSNSIVRECNSNIREFKIKKIKLFCAIYLSPVRLGWLGQVAASESLTPQISRLLKSLIKRWGFMKYILELYVHTFIHTR